MQDKYATACGLRLAPRQARGREEVRLVRRQEPCFRLQLAPGAGAVRHASWFRDTLGRSTWGRSERGHWEGGRRSSVD